MTTVIATLDELNRRFALRDRLSFADMGEGFIVAQVTTVFSTATIALQGAHVTTWQPTGQAPVIWLSPQAKFGAGKSIRGGVPICWPWFGPHATEASYPGHGFARTIPWQLLAANELPDGRMHLEFEPVMNDAARVQWPHASTVRYTVRIGQELEVELATTNTGDSAFPLGQALHTYFEIGDIRKANLIGLEDRTYIDKVTGGDRKRQAGPVSFSGETDRVYLATSGYCEICDPVLGRNILVTSTGSRSTVVWTPWLDKANKMGDFGPEGYLKMVCVETANAADDVITLAPGATHRMAAQYRSLPL